MHVLTSTINLCWLELIESVNGFFHFPHILHCRTIIVNMAHSYRTATDGYERISQFQRTRTHTHTPSVSECWCVSRMNGKMCNVSKQSSRQASKHLSTSKYFCFWQSEQIETFVIYWNDGRCPFLLGHCNQLRRMCIIVAPKATCRWYWPKRVHTHTRAQSRAVMFRSKRFLTAKTKLYWQIYMW